MRRSLARVGGGAVLYAWLAVVAASAAVLENTGVEPYRILTAQVLLARQGFSSGLMDNRPGNRTQGALADYMAANALSSESAAWERLQGDTIPVLGRYLIKPRDLAAIGSAPKDWEEASRLPSMACESLPELLSETFCVSERFLNELNPGLDWSTVTAGVEVVVLNWQPPPPIGVIDRVEIDTIRYRLRVFTTNNQLRLSFPCSVARDRTRIPSGELKMAVFAPNPDYTFNPANYPESPRARQIGRSLILPPGPNNPVGVYWIGLNRPGFGIHGTPHPETIGSMESHGCFRLMNRDVLTLSRFLRSGIPVLIKHNGPVSPASAGLSETAEE
jgi:lipoprotein-anchoring transpeptidase ErfK/SrfK